MALERKLTLAGRSIPENSIQFYGPLLGGCKPLSCGRRSGGNHGNGVFQHEFLQVPHGHAQASRRPNVTLKCSGTTRKKTKTWKRPVKITPQSSSCPSSLWRLQETTDSRLHQQPCPNKGSHSHQGEHIEHQCGDQRASELLEGRIHCAVKSL